MKTCTYRTKDKYPQYTHPDRMLKLSCQGWRGPWNDIDDDGFVD